MSALINKMLNLVGFDNEEEELMEEEGYNSNTSNSVQENVKVNNPFKKASKVVNLSDANQLKLVVMQPNSFDDAQEFYDKLVELKKNDTFLNRSLYKMKNITEEDVRNGIKTVVKVVGILGVLVHGVKSVVKDGKGIFEEGKEVVKSILKK